MASCTVCLKYVLFAFNLAMAALGVALVGVGVWLSVDEGGQRRVAGLTEMENDEYMISYTAVKSTADANALAVHVAYGMIALGAILCIAVLAGCWGAHRESAGLLTVYAVLLFALLVSLVGVGIWAQQEKDEVDDRYRGGWQNVDLELESETSGIIHKSVQSYRTDVKAREFIDALQTKFSCCGGRGHYKDWQNSNTGRFDPPKSCQVDGAVNRAQCNSSYVWYPQYRVQQNRQRVKSFCVYKDGCDKDYYWMAANEIREFLDERFSTIVGLCLGVAVCLGFCLIFTIMLCCILRRSTVITVN